MADFDGVQSAPSRITVTEADLGLRLAVAQGSVTVTQASRSNSPTPHSPITAPRMHPARFDGLARMGRSLRSTARNVLGHPRPTRSTTVRVEWDGVSSDPVPVEVVEEVASAGGDLYFDWVSSYIEDGVFDVVVSVQTTRLRR